MLPLLVDVMPPRLVLEFIYSPRLEHGRGLREYMTKYSETPNLNGARGLIYLLCYNRSMKALEIADELYPGILKYQSSVYMYSREMRKNGLLEIETTENKPGPPKYLRAVPHTIDNAMISIWSAVSNVLHERKVPKTQIRREVREVQDYLRLTAPLTIYLPRYLPQYFHGWRDVRELTWNESLSVFFYFNHRILDAAWALREKCDELPSPEVLQEIREGYHHDKKKFHWTAPPVRPHLIDALEEETIEFSFSDVNSIGENSDGPGDVLNPTTLSCRLILLHLGALHRHVGTNTAWMIKMVLESPQR